MANYYKSQGVDPEKVRRICEVFKFSNGVHPVRAFWKPGIADVFQLLNLATQYQHDLWHAEEIGDQDAQREAHLNLHFVGRACFVLTWYAFTNEDFDFCDRYGDCPYEIRKAFELIKLKIDETYDQMVAAMERFKANQKRKERQEDEGPKYQ